MDMVSLRYNLPPAFCVGPVLDQYQKIGELGSEAGIRKLGDRDRPSHFDSQKLGLIGASNWLGIF